MAVGAEGKDDEVELSGDFGGVVFDRCFDL